MLKTILSKWFTSWKKNCSMNTVSHFYDGAVFAVLVEVEIPAKTTDWNDKRSEEKNERSDFQILVFGVAVHDSDGDDGVAESDQAKKTQPRAGQKQRWVSEKRTSCQRHFYFIKIIFSFKNAQFFNTKFKKWLILPYLET